MRKFTKLFLFTLIFTSILTFQSTVALAEVSLLKLGMSGDRVLQLQKKLQELGYYQGGLDGAFGPGTFDAVVNFQSNSGLEVDGIAGPGTLRSLNLSFGPASPGEPVSTIAPGSGEQPALKMGMSGDRVLQLQKKLQELGYYQGSLDGAFGPGTFNAVFSFQSDSNLGVDGVAGLETMSKLQAAITPRSALPSRGLSGDRKALTIVSFARQFLGVPYTWGGNSPSGFDCSGFVHYVFSSRGIELPRAADGQFTAGTGVSKLAPGDLVFFSTYEPGPSHVGIYIGGDQFIHSSSGAGYVTITPLSEPFYRDRYLGARRVL